MQWPALLLTIAGLPVAAAAQVNTVRLDLSGSRIRYAEGVRANAFTLTPEISSDWTNAVFRTLGSYSQLSGGGSSMQGIGSLSLYSPTFGMVLGELEGFAGGSRTDGVSTSQVSGTGRAHLSARSAGVWLGVGVGTATGGGVRRPSRHGEIGAWAGRGRGRASFTVTPTAIDDSIRYTDVNLIATASLQRFELVASAGSRSGSQPEIFGTPVRSWASASVVSWLTERIAVVAGAGRYPVDLAQGFPGGTYGSVGLRMAARFGTAVEPDVPSGAVPPPPVVSDAPVGNLHVASTGGERRLIFIRVPAARSIEIAGDFNAWEALQMERQRDGWWSIELFLPRGRYQTSLRVDGGSWIAPPGLLPLRDEFEVESGLLDVP